MRWIPVSLSDDISSAILNRPSLIIQVLFKQSKRTKKKKECEEYKQSSAVWLISIVTVVKRWWKRAQIYSAAYFRDNNENKENNNNKANPNRVPRYWLGPCLFTSNWYLWLDYCLKTEPWCCFYSGKRKKNTEQWIIP